MIRLRMIGSLLYMQWSVKIPLLLQKSIAKNNAKRHHYLVNLQFELKMQYLPNPNSKFKKSLKIDNSGNHMFVTIRFQGRYYSPYPGYCFLSWLQMGCDQFHAWHNPCVPHYSIWGTRRCSNTYNLSCCEQTIKVCIRMLGLINCISISSNGLKRSNLLG